MVKKSRYLRDLQETYLFSEIKKRRDALSFRDLISLSIGDTTEPIAPFVTEKLVESAKRLGTEEGYLGYGPENGFLSLRQKISEVFYKGLFQADEIFISDGAKSDIARLQFLFDRDVHVAIQNPTYPAYHDACYLSGKTSMTYMPCGPDNDFFPPLDKLPKIDLLFFCSPNNPTGAVATKEELRALVKAAQERDFLILFDSAYSAYIKDPHLPKTIYEIEGASEVAIEINSFSKMAGFTGIRLGWSVVPHALKSLGGRSLNQDYFRIVSTTFNGASNIAQFGGLAVLDPLGLKQIQRSVNFYLDNASLLRHAIEPFRPTFGGINAPYLWVQFPGRKSWDIFDDLLQKLHLVTIPGSGFGSMGEGFIRLSAFGSRHHIEEAAERLGHYFKS